jgi:hypothetical protein
MRSAKRSRLEVSSRRARWLFTAFVWSVVIVLVGMQAAGWLAAGVPTLAFASVAAILAAAATIRAWLWE